MIALSVKSIQCILKTFRATFWNRKLLIGDPNKKLKHLISFSAVSTTCLGVFVGTTYIFVPSINTREAEIIFFFSWGFHEVFLVFLLKALFNKNRIIQKQINLFASHFSWSVSICKSFYRRRFFKRLYERNRSCILNTKEISFLGQ